MIQRIQSVYLLLVTILLVVAICLPVGQFIGSDGIATHIPVPYPYAASSYDDIRQSFTDRLLHCFLCIHVYFEK